MPKPIEKRFDTEKIIHVFLGHDCVTEVIVRGIIQELISFRSDASFHVSTEKEKAYHS